MREDGAGLECRVECPRKPFLLSIRQPACSTTYRVTNKCVHFSKQARFLFDHGTANPFARLWLSGIQFWGRDSQMFYPRCYTFYPRACLPSHIHKQYLYWHELHHWSLNPLQALHSNRRNISCSHKSFHSVLLGLCRQFPMRA